MKTTKSPGACDVAAADYERPVTLLDVRLVLVGTQVLGTFVALLWVRVVLKSITVLFNVGASLKSIDRKTKRPA